MEKCCVCGSNKKNVQRHYKVLSCMCCATFFWNATTDGVVPCTVANCKCIEHGLHLGIESSRSCRLKKCIIAGMDQSLVGSRLAKKNVARVCVACATKESVFYGHGVLCCKACYLFFQRAMTGKVIVRQCDIKDGKCVEDDCKSCRLQNCKNKGMVMRIDPASKEREDVDSSGTDTENGSLDQTESKSHTPSRTEADRSYDVCNESKEVQPSYGVDREINQALDEALVADEAHSSDTNTVMDNRNQVDLRSLELNNVSTYDTESTDVSINTSQSEIHLKRIQKDLDELHKAFQNDLQECEKKFTESEKEYQMRENLKNEQNKELQLELEKARKLINELTVERNGTLTQVDKLQQDLEETKAMYEKHKTDLLIAVQTQSLDAIQNIVEQKGLPIDDKWTDYTVLVEALKIGKKDVAEYLLERNCRVNKTVKSSSSADTPLHYAIKLKDIDVVKCLLEKKASVTMVNAQGNSPLHLAFIFEQPNIVDLLLAYMEENDIYENPGNEQGLSHLHIACTRQNKEIIEKFLEKGASISQSVNEDSMLWSGYTAMHFAVHFKSIEAAKVITRPLHLALYNEMPLGNDMIVDLLYKAVNKKEENHTDNNGLSYLHVAVTRNDLETVEYYLDAGNNIDSQVMYEENKFYHFSPLHFAVLYKNREMAKLLIDRGANVNLSDDYSYGTPLHMAVTSGNVELIELLLESGADVKTVHPKGQETVLHKLMHCLRYPTKNQSQLQNNLLPYINRFVTMGCDVNAKNNSGDTVLHNCHSNASTKDFPQNWIEALLKCGADINLQNDKGETPLDNLLNKFKGDTCSTFAFLYDHVENLKALGMTVHHRNTDFNKNYRDRITNCLAHNFKKLDDTEIKRRKEIEKLKKKVICDNPKTSLYDLFIVDQKFTKIKFTHSSVEEILKDKDYPLYGDLIRLHCQRYFKFQENKIAQKRTHAVDQREHEVRAPKRRHTK